LTEADRVDKLMKLFTGLLHSDSGVAMPPPARRAALADSSSKEQVFQGTLLHNLTFVAKEKSDAASESELWELCRRVGLSSGLLGESYTRGWADKLISPTLHRVTSDFGKIALVRALLQRPDVLLINHVADFWTAEEQVALISAVRGFLSGQLDSCLDADEDVAHEAGKRTVLWCTTDSVLHSMVTQEKDMVLTIHTHSTATIAPALSM
jgi:hypothetical protein